MTFNDRIRATLERINRLDNRGLPLDSMPAVRASMERNRTLDQVNDDVTEQWSPVTLAGERVVKTDTPMPVIDRIAGLDQSTVDRLIPADYSWNPRAGR